MKIKNISKWLVIISAASTVSAAPSLWAQADSSGSATPTQKGNPNRMEWRQQMMREHQKTMSQLEEMDAVLDQDVQRMNQAQGNAKVDAMEAVINNLVKQHNLIRDQMREAYQRMVSRGQRGQRMMGGAEQGAGGASTGSNAQSGEK